MKRNLHRPRPGNTQEERPDTDFGIDGVTAMAASNAVGTKRTTSPKPAAANVKDVLRQLGGIPASRLRVRPRFGNAREQDVIDLLEHENIPCELIDGYLVEKAMGTPESFLTMKLGTILNNYLDENPLGILLGADGTLRILPRMVRIPDISFLAWGRLPGRKVPAEPVPALAPNLAIEVLSKANTKGEMTRKCADYFLAGVETYWEIDPKRRTVGVYTSPDAVVQLKVGDVLQGGSVLPGFKLPLAKLFGYLDQLG